MNDIQQLKEHIGQRLKDLRTQKGFTLEYVSLDLDISFSNYLYMEKGTRGAPKLEMLCKLADFYGVPVDYFFQDYAPTSRHPLPQRNITERKLLSEFRKLNLEKKNLAVRVLRVFGRD
ncbi:MAG: helix-turn-helix domain-containing protein [Candidatus Margulisbacteria bacterium]|jgi:transcriptional regulator with XRE-family HTH domain|nr:helix-turn-helix domain-containing protein [Candidatus Margulisiibacteriota bacterium]